MDDITPPHRGSLLRHQLALFRFPEEADDVARANAMFLWEIAPLWRQSQPEGSPPYLELDMILPGSQSPVSLDIRPAQIVDKKTGSVRAVYPGIREEIVDTALRKMAANGRGGVSEDNDGITCHFTLRALKDELDNAGHSIAERKHAKKLAKQLEKENKPVPPGFIPKGHTYNYSQLREALEVLALARVTFIAKSPTQQSFRESNYYPELAGSSYEDFRAATPNSELVVKFHPLVTYAMQKNAYYPYDWHTCMKLSTPAARYLYKRLVYRWRSATFTQTQTLSLENLSRDSGYYNSLGASRPQDRGRLLRFYWKKVFDELAAHELIFSNYELEKPNTVNQTNRITVRPGKVLVNQIVEGSKYLQKRDMRDQLSLSFDDGEL